jgi:hypothetical protein
VADADAASALSSRSSLSLARCEALVALLALTTAEIKATAAEATIRMRSALDLLLHAPVSDSTAVSATAATVRMPISSGLKCNFLGCAVFDGNPIMRRLPDVAHKWDQWRSVTFAALMTDSRNDLFPRGRCFMVVSIFVTVNM